MKDIPVSIKRYLQNLNGDHHADGYLYLNERQEILAGDGWVGIRNLASIDRTKSPAQSIPVLEGLLPGSCTAPTVIKLVHVDQDYYFDIHLFHDNAGAWVLFIDKTRSAKLMHEEQQNRLSNELYNIKPLTGN